MGEAQAPHPHVSEPIHYKVIIQPDEELKFGGASATSIWWVTWRWCQQQANLRVFLTGRRQVKMTPLFGMPRSTLTTNVFRHPLHTLQRRLAHNGTAASRTVAALAASPPPPSVVEPKKRILVSPYDALGSLLGNAFKERSPRLVLDGACKRCTTRIPQKRRV